MVHRPSDRVLASKNPLKRRTLVHRPTAAVTLGAARLVQLF